MAQKTKRRTRGYPGHLCSAIARYVKPNRSLFNIKAIMRTRLCNVASIVHAYHDYVYRLGIEGAYGHGTHATHPTTVVLD